jgi:peptidoglycan-associated lipoprotein
MKKLLIGLVLVNLLVACASEKPKEPVAAAPAPAPVVEAPAPAPAPAPVVEVDPLNDPANILANRSVYFPFDVSAVQEADKPIVLAHAKYLGEQDRKSVV